MPDPKPSAAALEAVQEFLDRQEGFFGREYELPKLALALDAFAAGRVAEALRSYLLLVSAARIATGRQLPNTSQVLKSVEEDMRRLVECGPDTPQPAELEKP